MSRNIKRGMYIDYKCTFKSFYELLLVNRHFTIFEWLKN